MITKQKTTLRVLALAIVLASTGWIVYKYYADKHEAWIKHCHAIDGRVQITRMVNPIVNGRSDGGTDTSTQNLSETDCIDSNGKILDIEG